ncbi:MAG TPA: alpha/beta hydrolase-fold protein [Acidimicrobiia bacterium]|nr:alpha/beta hydrolase-fold protein [Acidimicrobiia bacterium]
MLMAWWFLALLVGAAAAVPAAGLAFRARRRRRRRAGLAVSTGWHLALHRLTLLLTTLTFAVAATAAAVNDHYSYIPSFHALFGDVSPDLVSYPVAARSAQRSGPAVIPVAATTNRPGKAAGHGTVEKVSVDGPVSGIGARDTYVYLPPDYFDPTRSTARFPVLYLLHGSPGISIDWIRAGSLDRTMDDLLAKHQIAPFIVVMPDVNGGYSRDTECEDIPGGPRTQTYLVTDVVHYVDANYRTIPGRGARVLGGLSTGGYCALNLVLRHQDVFSGIISHSGYDRPDHNLYTGDLFGSDLQAQRANTPGLYLPTVPLTKPLGVYLDVGASDGQSRAESVELSRIFERRGVPVDFHDFPDESHNWSVWKRNLVFSLPWVSSWFGSAPEPQAPVAPSLSASGSIVSAAPRRNSSSSSRGTGLSSSQWRTHSSTMAIQPRKTSRRPAGSSEKPRAAAMMSTTAARVSSKTARSRSSDVARRATAW